MPSPFVQTAITYWTEPRLQDLTGGKKLIVLPTTAPDLLRTLSLLNADGSMARSDRKKFHQINHMVQLLIPHLRDISERHEIPRILDIGCGTSYLTLLLSWYFAQQGKVAEIIGIDRNEAVVKTSRDRATSLGMSRTKFRAVGVEDFSWEKVYGELFPNTVDVPARPNLVIALHACDTATDQALAIAAKLEADHIAVAPCCQAELARQWQEDANPPAAFRSIFQTPALRREVAAQMTDVMRILWLKNRGYEVRTTEFVEATHTPKNRLIAGVRRGRFLASAGEELQALKAALGGHDTFLSRLVETN